jgi:hypothetical protein
MRLRLRGFSFPGDIHANPVQIPQGLKPPRSFWNSYGTSKLVP